MDVTGDHDCPRSSESYSPKRILDWDSFSAIGQSEEKNVWVGALRPKRIVGWALAKAKRRAELHTVGGRAEFDSLGAG